MVGVMATSFKRTYASTPRGSQVCCIQCPQPHGRPLSTHALRQRLLDAHRKSDSISLVISKIQIKIIVRYCSQPTRTAKIKKIDIRDVKQLKSSYFAGRKAKEYSHFRKQFDKFLQSEAYILYTNVYTGFIYNS